MWQKGHSSFGNRNAEPRCGSRELILYKASRFAAIGAFVLAPPPFASAETVRLRDRYVPILGASVAALGFLHTSIDVSLQIPGFR